MERWRVARGGVSCTVSGVPRHEPHWVDVCCQRAVPVPQSAFLRKAQAWSAGLLSNPHALELARNRLTRARGRQAFHLLTRRAASA